MQGETKMALTSPGVEIDVINESFYVPAGTGSTPLIIVTTAQDKANASGTGFAAGTQSANANTVYLISSQRELTSTFGDPKFYTDASSNPLNGYEINEYGLQAAYSFLGIANRAYILRANVDLGQLTGSAIMPTSSATDGTYWLDLSETVWGIFEWQRASQTFKTINPIVITDVNQLTGATSTGTPVTGLGVPGDYAVNTTHVTNPVYRKNSSGVWHQVGSSDWSADIGAGADFKSSRNYDRPLWKTAETNAATGSVWIKENNVNSGFYAVLKKYDAQTGTWTKIRVDGYANEATADRYELPKDLSGGVRKGNLVSIWNVNQATPPVADNQIFRAEGGPTIITGKANPSFTSTQAITVYETVADVAGWGSSKTVTLGGTDANAFASAFNGAGFVNLLATVDPSTKAITITHQIGGSFKMKDVSSGSVLSDAGLGTANASTYGSYDSSKVANLYTAPSGDTDASVYASNWKRLSYVASYTEPTNEPADGTLWYNTNLEADIMVRGTSGWKGYSNEYPSTDPSGPQFSATKPTTQSDGTSLAANDLWIDTSDLENYPMLYVYDTALSDFRLIDKTDQSTENGVVFADARISTVGTNAEWASITTLLGSNYTDPDAPAYTLYPQGILLFNTRRSGYNVKEFKKNYITTTKFGPGVAGYNTDTWTTKSANNNNGSGSFGRKAVRKVIVSQIKSEIDTNQAIREDQRGFNIIACPGYPEAIANMITLNNDRKDTAFIIGDTPLRLEANATAITNWANNAAGASDNGDEGLVSGNDYLGVFYPAGQTTDNTGKNIVVPASHMILRVFAHNDNVAYPWFAPAGTRRGIVDNATSVGYIDAMSGEFQVVSLTESVRDSMFTAQINPITFFSGTGLLNYGNQTKTAINSALDRINVSRLVVYLRTQLDTLAKPFIFEPNDTLTRNEIKQSIESFLLELVGQRALYDYLVVCDETNNTPTRIDQNELYVDIAIEPVKSVEFIYIPLRIYNTGGIATLGNQ